MDARHEWKHEISWADLLILRQRLRAVAAVDEHAAGGVYQIRSLYFDTPGDRALREKIDGVDRREKFRLRCYNGDTGLIHLEKKSKCGGLCWKQIDPVAEDEVRRLMAGEFDWMRGSGRPLVQELYSKMRTQCLRPKTLVDYTREPFVYGPGNVRVTMDYHLRTSLNCAGFLDFGPGAGPTIPAGEPPVLLEVKWDAFLPAVIRDAVGLEGRHACAFSKYAACRVYG